MEKQPSPFHQDQTPLVMVLDSGSAMQEKDVAPDRLTRAKQKMEDILAQRSGGLNALIAYAGSAHLAMPLTEDSSVFKPMLEALGPDVMPLAGKDSSLAIPLVEHQLKGSPNAGTILLITNDVNASSVSAWRQALNKEMPETQLIILAAGNVDAPSDIPLRLDALQQLTSEVNGSVITMSVDDSDVKTIIRRVENHASLNTKNSQPWQDMGYGLLIPIAVLLLLWFRRGWIVQWACAGILINSIALSALLLNSHSAYAVPVKSTAQPEAAQVAASFSFGDKVMQAWLDLWMTRDQQGQWYFNRGNYLKAANHYDDPLHKGVAFYYASQFDAAYKVLNQNHDFNMQLHAASALARGRQYVAARALLSKLVHQQPDNKIAQHNLVIVVAVIKEINEFSKSQSEGMDASQDASHELGSEPQTSDGAETQVTQEALLDDKMTADQLLESDASIDKWFQRVESDPKQFLQSKFSIQYQQQREEK
ncbi:MULTISPECIES: VWA domain-containing protein [Vibrio]|uniref:VWA domain-containing protein n=1 Tax=Vibrio TaxID=662 RepID=UPI000B5C60B3|nr:MULTISPECIES: VWA domain-containing protein [Vibrio]HBV76057.1 VWA domain-containing protein [Vibrio sp.]